MWHHLSEEELTAGLDSIRSSPADGGVLEMIVIRPLDKERRVLAECELSLSQGAEGDQWVRNCWKKLPDGSAHPDVQLTLMNTRCVDLLAGEKERWALAGDQLYVDMDLSGDNLPVGQRLAVGTALLEITEVKHTGCGLFAERFGVPALKFVNSPVGKELHLRGIYAKVVQDGVVRVGDVVTKVEK